MTTPVEAPDQISWRLSDEDKALFREVANHLQETAGFMPPNSYLIRMGLNAYKEKFICNGKEEEDEGHSQVVE